MKTILKVFFFIIFTFLISFLLIIGNPIKNVNEENSGILDGEWEVIRIGGDPISPFQNSSFYLPMLKFNAINSTVYGFDDCGSFSGTYKFNKSYFTFDVIRESECLDKYHVLNGYLSGNLAIQQFKMFSVNMLRIKGEKGSVVFIRAS